MNENSYYVYAARYSDLADAEADLALFAEAAIVGVVGKYDVAVVTRDEKGKVHVNQHTSATSSGGWKGLLAGGIVGLLFPPSILAGGLLGAAGGALVGKLWGSIPRADLKDLGELLDDGEAALIIIGQSTLDETVDKALNKAEKKLKKEVKADRKELEKAIDSLETE